MHGRDIVGSASKFAKMNMVILGDGHSNIERLDSPTEFVDKEYRKVITNIPFNLKSFDGDVAGKYTSTACDANEVCVRHCINAIDEGGEAALILPQHIAYLPRYQTLREWIRDNSRIKAIIRLPKSVFKSYADAQTFILLLEKVWVRNTVDFPLINIVNDGFSNDKRREPILENDIPELLNNIDSLRRNYKVRKANVANFTFFDSSEPVRQFKGKTIELSEVLEVVSKKSRLNDSAMYNEPRISSENNTVSVLKQRRGSSIKAKEKVIAKPGDLIISTLHTQSGNGLFAFCDKEYIASSQIVASVKEDIVTKQFLKCALRKAFPRLTKNDLVGRETYKAREILSVRIPYPTRQINKTFEEAEEKHLKIDEDARKKHMEVDKKLEKYFK